MGAGYDNGIAREAIRIKEVVEALKAHPNYNDPIPLQGESQIEFALRVAAHLISPPMQEGEDTTIECTDLAAAVQFMGKELNETWAKYNSEK